MSFTTPCFIRKNTPELRDKLRELGYKVLTNFSNFPCLATMPDDGIVVPATEINRNRVFDCVKNEELFLALAALRDDSMFMQLFVYRKDTMLHKKGDIFYCYHGGNKVMKELIANGTIKKLTPTEIIARFKQEES
jgi:hypothetical protein